MPTFKNVSDQEIVVPVEGGGIVAPGESITGDFELSNHPGFEAVNQTPATPAAPTAPTTAAPAAPLQGQTPVAPPLPPVAQPKPNADGGSN